MSTGEIVDVVLVEGARVPDVGCRAADCGGAVASVISVVGIRLRGIPDEEVDAAPPFLAVLRVFIVSSTGLNLEFGDSQRKHQLLRPRNRSKMKVY